MYSTTNATFCTFYLKILEDLLQFWLWEQMQNGFLAHVFFFVCFFSPRQTCLDFYSSTAGSGIKMVRKRMHLIYKGGHWVYRPTQLSKCCTASRQRLAGRSSNHIFPFDTHSCANILENTHFHICTHTHIHMHTNLRCIHIGHSLSMQKNRLRTAETLANVALPAK